MSNPSLFQWLSPLGLGAAIFLGYGVLNVLVGIFIPFVHRASPGKEPATYIVDMWCTLWFAFGVFQISVVWFGLKAAQPWALPTLVAADAAQLTGWVLYGRKTHDWGAPLFLYPAFLLLPAAILTWIGFN